jgi:hypothetical protein
MLKSSALKQSLEELCKGLQKAIKNTSNSDKQMAASKVTS